MKMTPTGGRSGIFVGRKILANMGKGGEMGMTVEEWAKDFKAFVDELQMPRDDYKGIIAYIEDGVKLQEPDWINVKDKLPDNGQDLLAYLNYGEETRIAPCNYADGVWFDCMMNCVVALPYITHWMPLPKSPKEET